MFKNNKDKEKTERKLDNLINLTENHTRTERHLEQYSNIGDPENKENARKLQDLRNKEMNTLKNDILGEEDIQDVNEQIEQIKEKYESTQGYINDNQNHINSEMLQNMQNKQQNRKQQLENLEENKDN